MSPFLLNQITPAPVTDSDLIEMQVGDETCVICEKRFVINEEEGYSNICDSCWREQLSEDE